MYIICKLSYSSRNNDSPKKSANGSSVPKKSLKMSKAEWKWNGVPPPAKKREGRRGEREREREREREGEREGGGVVGERNVFINLAGT